MRGEFHDFRAEVKRDVGELRDEMNAGLSRIFNRMDSDQRWTAQQSTTGRGMLVTAILGVVGIAFSFTALVTRPLSEEARRHTERLDNIEMRVITNAQTLGGILEHGENTDRVAEDLERDQEQIEDGLSALSDRVSKFEGRLEIVREVLRDVDQAGSRRWVKENE